MINNNLNLILNGLGLFCQAYLLFAIGNISIIFSIIYPNCFAYLACSRHLIKSIVYSSVLGIIIGMIIIGIFVVNNLGRKISMIISVFLILIGNIGMACAYGDTDK